MPMRILAGAIGALALLICAAPPSLATSPEVPVGSWPLTPAPEVVARFDPPESAYGAGHRGVDLAGHVGQEVRSGLPGAVTFAGTVAGKGVIVVSHGDTRTTYEPVAASVAVGTTVESGHVIGTLQLPGAHCFPRACLHWGWLRGELYLDPLLLVGVRRVRLLPLSGPVARLSPRMSLLIGPPQPIRRDVRIKLGGVQRSVPQHLLHRPQIRPTFK